MEQEKRKSLSKRLRFEVFKRDRFTCQYCGKASPDVVLHADHVKPVSLGGKNTITNLITSCKDCNLGKSNIELSDDAAISKQRKQIEALADRDEQITMMIDWQEGMIKAEERLTRSVEREVNSHLMEGKVVSEHGLDIIRKAIKKLGYECVMKQLSDCYVRSASAEDFGGKWSKAITYKQSSGDDWKASIHYVKGILKNRVVLNERRFYAELGTEDLTSEQISELCAIAKTCQNQSDFFTRAEVVIYG